MTNILKNNIKFMQLKNLMVLTQEQLRDIACLIYATDDYIYPAMFDTQENAILLITQMINMEDPMFCLDNLFVAFSEENIAALILWKKGSLKWKPDIYNAALEKLRIPVPKYLEKVKEEYFSSYENTDEGTVSILNVSVSEKMRGRGIGQGILEAFMQSNQETCDRYELVVLAENLGAFHIYKKAGFHLKETLKGFSVDERDLVCYRMVR